MIYYSMDLPEPKTDQARTESKKILREIMATLTDKEVKAIGGIKKPFLIENGFYSYTEGFRQWDSYGIQKEENGTWKLWFFRWAEENKDRTHTIEGVALENIGASIIQTLDWDAPEK